MLTRQLREIKQQAKEKETRLQKDLFHMRKDYEEALDKCKHKLEESVQEVKDGKIEIQVGCEPFCSVHLIVSRIYAPNSNASLTNPNSTLSI